MVEGQSIDAAVLAQYLHDVFLLAGRQFVFAVMVAVIRTVTTTEVVLHLSSCLRFQIFWYVVIDIAEAPRLPYLLILAIALALPTLPR